MGKLSKFENVDVLSSLEAIMRTNTGFFQNDFDIDKRIITKAAGQPAAEDKTLLWLSRPSGTHCFRERDVFLKNTAAHNTWRFHKEQSHDRILAYAVELTGIEDGKIKGNLYELDYTKHYERVKEQALAADTHALIYENGSREQPRIMSFTERPTHSLGSLNGLKQSPTTRKPCVICYSRKNETAAP